MLSAAVSGWHLFNAGERRAAAARLKRFVCNIPAEVAEQFREALNRETPKIVKLPDTNEPGESTELSE